ncbi:MAG: hypothetical protein U0Q18_19710 [Bryobacteraceae bacterium]
MGLRLNACTDFCKLSRRRGEAHEAPGFYWQLTIARPGPIKRQRDDTPDLLTWLVRAQHGGRHIAPGDGTDPVELVDVKDVPGSW